MTFKCIDCDVILEINAESAEEAMREMMPHYMESHKDMMDGHGTESREDWIKRFTDAWNS